MNSRANLLEILPSNLPDAADVYTSAFLEGLAPDPLLTVSEWADEYRYLSASASAEAGKWRTSRVPYLREIMDCLSPHHAAQIVVFKKATQVGGTECGNNWLGYIVDRAPAPTMLVLPTSSTAKRASKTRLAPMIDDTPVLRGKINEAKSRDSGNTTMLKEFAGGVLILAGANSAAELKSSPVKNIFLDEIDEYPDDVDGQGDPEELAEKRTDTFARKKIFKASTPTEKSRSRIDRAYRASDQRRYYVPCPECAHEQWLRWDQMRWETRKTREVHDLESGEIRELAEGEASEHPVTDRDTGELAAVWYECEACHFHIEEHHKTALLEGGRWVAQNAGPDRAAGFHLSALYSPVGWFAWRQAVLKFLTADADKTGELMKVFTNTILGEVYEEKGETVDEHMLKERVEAYRLGQVPDAALLLFAGVDVQHDRLEARIWGYGRGEESWLIDRQILFGNVTLAESWDALVDLLDKPYPRSNGATMRIRGMAIDAGDGNTVHYVYQFARKYAHRGVMAVKGQSISGKPIIGRPTDQDVSFRGKTVKRGVKLWPVGSDTAKAVFYNRLKLEAPGPGYVHLPQGLPDEEFEQMTAERMVKRSTPRGFSKIEWIKEKGRRNEALDCRVYADAAAMRFGIARAPWDRLEALLNPAQNDLLAAPQPSTAQSVQTSAPAENNPAGTTQEHPDTEPGAGVVEPQAAAEQPETAKPRPPAAKPPPASNFATRW